MRLVVTPFMVREIESQGRAGSYRAHPTVHPQRFLLPQFLLLGGSLTGWDSRLGGAGRFVNNLPIRLLAGFGLYMDTGGRIGVSVWEYRVSGGSYTVESDPGVTGCKMESFPGWSIGLTCNPNIA